MAKTKKQPSVSAKEKAARLQTDKLIKEIEKYVGPLSIQEQQMAYTLVKENS